LTEILHISSEAVRVLGYVSFVLFRTLPFTELDAVRT